MEAEPITEVAERIIHEAALVLMTPAAGECLVCFVARQLDEFGCDGTHRFALKYRDRVAPRATALLKQLGVMGACCCDCEMFMNTYTPAAEFWQPGRWVEVARGGQEWVDPAPPAAMPLCEGVRRGSTKPCSNWERSSW